MSKSKVSISASDFSSVSVVGSFYRAGSGRPTKAWLTLDGEEVRVCALADGSVLGTAPRRDVEVSAKVGSIPRQVSAAQEWMFETADSDGIDRILGRPGDGLLPWLEEFHPKLIVLAVVVLVSVVGIFRFGIPAATHMAVNATPQAVETAIAAGTLQSLELTFFEKSEADPERRIRLEGRFEALLAAYGNSETARLAPNFELLFRKAPLVGPNALALPGGQVILTDELLDLIDDDDLITAILAHEIGHVHHRHSLYALYRSAGVSAMILFLGGDLSQLAEDAVVQGAVLSNLASSRGMEKEADLTAVTLAGAGGYPPTALIEALEELTGSCETCDEMSWLSTHPAFKERARAIRAAIKER